MDMLARLERQMLHCFLLLGKSGATAVSTSLVSVLAHALKKNIRHILSKIQYDAKEFICLLFIILCVR